MTRTWIAAHEPSGVHVAADLIGSGASLVDAAVSGALAQGAAEPLWTSLGGFGVALVHQGATGRTDSFGFHALAPLSAGADLFGVGAGAQLEEPTPGTFEVPGRANQIGYRAVATPGVAAGLDAMHSRYGTLPLSAVLEPVAELLEAGPPVSNHVYATWAADDRAGYEPPLTRLTYTRAAAAIYGATGELPTPGTRLANPDYANTLRAIGRDGFDDFYRGEIASLIVADFAEHGGLIATADLDGYRVDTQPPVTSSYRDLEVRTPPLPSLTEQIHLALGALSSAGLDGLDPLGPDYVELVATALTDPARTRTLLATPAAVGRDTTHLICVDEGGDVVTMTHSLGAASGVVTPGLGFMFNGAMHRFDPRQGRPNSIRAGFARPTGMAPTILLRDGSAQVVVGGAGGLGILQGVVQTVLAVVEHRQSAQVALDAPRFSAYGTTLRLEAGYPAATVRDLARRGLDAHHLPDALDRHHVGRVVLATRLHTGRWDAAADPRGGGIALAC